MNGLTSRKWLNLCGVAEISHFGICNFFWLSEFKQVGDSDRNKILKKPADPVGFVSGMADLGQEEHHEVHKIFGFGKCSDAATRLLASAGRGWSRSRIWAGLCRWPAGL